MMNSFNGKTLEAKDLVKYYGKKQVVKGVSITVNQGEVVGLLGPNGAGKTTTFYIMIGLIKPNEGDVLLNNQSISFLPMYKRARLGISYLPQESSIFRKLSVEDNIMAILQTLPLTEAEMKEKCDYLLEKFHISHLRKQMAYQLSGGERRRVEIARSLVINPSFLLLDEPFTGIDPIAVADIQEIIKDLSKSGIGIFLTDHNVRETLYITNRSYIIYDGKILKSGTSEFLVNDPEARALYLGEKFKL